MPDYFPSIRRHLFLTGDKQVGKSTILRRLIDTRGLDCVGFETRHLEIDGMRRAHVLHGLVDMPPYENDCICCVRVNDRRSVAVPHVFDVNGAKILRLSIESPSPYILMDELGKLEQKSECFVGGIFAALDSGKRVLGVLQQCTADHLSAIMERDDVTVITVTSENRDMLLEMLIKAFDK